MTKEFPHPKCHFVLTNKLKLKNRNGVLGLILLITRQVFEVDVLDNKSKVVDPLPYKLKILAGIRWMPIMISQKSCQRKKSLHYTQ